jgi:hypothetical protein
MARWQGSLFVLLACGATAARAGDVPEVWAPAAGCCPCDGGRVATDRFYGRLDSLLWWTKRQSLPPW